MDKANGNAQYSATCRMLLETVEQAKKELNGSHARTEATLDVSDRIVGEVATGLEEELGALREQLRAKKEDERRIR
ncbi:hypothetical protein M9435_006675 [Picochlorum sp. BPE23]|nr:hypothetical protein M9435_006675 [Picochlorum sp. BPE23]|eukprot:jgi/Picre1/31923/NNA_007271.t1